MHHSSAGLLTRRRLLAGLGASGAMMVAGGAHAQSALDASTVGVRPNAGSDQTAALAAALEAAKARGLPLFLPAGEYLMDGLPIPGSSTLLGLQGLTYLIAAGSGPAARIAGSSDVVLEGVGFAPAEGAGPTGERGLLELESSAHLRISGCRFVDSRGNGIAGYRASGVIAHCDFTGHAGAAIFSNDGLGLAVTNNRVTDCGNGGVLIWASNNQRDGSIITGNVIEQIRADGGGNGQNGNGINVFRADGVIVADNQISGCAFTAIRINSTNNTQVRGNTCLNSGEVAIFSEFAFSGSVIAGNIVDGAAGGISITNLDSGGHLATCSGNIVRNISPRSEVNPDTTPFGIFAEADVAVTGNAVDAVPGTGIGAGWGPYLRNVFVADNVVSGCDIGIGVSVAEGAGKAVVSGNMVAGARRAAIAGLAWTDVRSDDRVRDSAGYPNVTLSGNAVS